MTSFNKNSCCSDIRTQDDIPFTCSCGDVFNVYLCVFLGISKLWAFLRYFKTRSPSLILSFNIVLAADIFVVFSISFPTVDPPNNIRLPRPIDHKYCPPPPTWIIPPITLLYKYAAKYITLTTSYFGNLHLLLFV